MLTSFGRTFSIGPTVLRRSCRCRPTQHDDGSTPITLRSELIRRQTDTCYELQDTAETPGILSYMSAVTPHPFTTDRCFPLRTETTIAPPIAALQNFQAGGGSITVGTPALRAPMRLQASRGIR